MGKFTKRRIKHISGSLTKKTNGKEVEFASIPSVALQMDFGSFTLRPTANLSEDVVRKSNALTLEESVLVSIINRRLCATSADSMDRLGVRPNKYRY